MFRESYPENSPQLMPAWRSASFSLSGFLVKILIRGLRDGSDFQGVNNRLNVVVDGLKPNLSDHLDPAHQFEIWRRLRVLDQYGERLNVRSAANHNENPSRDFAWAHGLARLGLGTNIAVHGYSRLPNLAGFASHLTEQFAQSIVPASLV
jgi:hypothetical protein